MKVHNIYELKTYANHILVPLQCTNEPSLNSRWPTFTLIEAFVTVLWSQNMTVHYVVCVDVIYVDVSVELSHELGLVWTREYSLKTSM